MELSLGDIFVVALLSAKSFHVTRFELAIEYSKDCYFQQNEEQRISSVDIVKQSISLTSSTPLAKTTSGMGRITGAMRG